MSNYDDRFTNEYTEQFDELVALLPDDSRRKSIFRYYEMPENQVYLKHIIQALKILDYAKTHKQYAWNVIKTTRAGYTTNSVLSALMMNKTVLIVEPTNKILYETIGQIMNLYIKITGDDTKKVRQIPSNRDGCSIVVDKMENNPNFDVLPMITAGRCANCKGIETFPNEVFLPKATPTICTVKTMMNEKRILKKDYKPDIIAITYDKLLTLGMGQRGEFFNDLISNVEVVIFDELGHYLSKTTNGVTIKETRSTEDSSTSKKIYEKINLLKLYTEKIEDVTARSMITDLIENYIEPWSEKTVKKALEMKEYPRFLKNNLSEELVAVKYEKDGKSTYKSILKHEAVKEKFGEFYECFEDLINEENSDLVILLTQLIEVMSFSKYVVKKTSSLNFEGMYDVHVEELQIVETTDELLDALENRFNKKQVTILTDATMPAYSFDVIKKKKIIDVYFGDPAKTNSQLLIAQDAQNKQMFSVWKWFRDDEYREEVIHKIRYVADMVGWDKVVVWSPNKKIHEDLMTEFKNLNYRICDHENENPMAIQFTYYNSIMARGVECNRRVQIMLGKASKPKGSFKHIAYMQRVNWNVFDDRELKKLADEKGFTVEEFKNSVREWNIKEKSPFSDEYVYRHNDVPEQLLEYFSLYSDAIQKEKTHQDCWQAGSRAKDAWANDRSILLCIGWRDRDIWEMIKWGGVRNIKYKIYAGEVIKTIEGQQSMITPPRVIKLRWWEDEIIEDIIFWLNDAELIPKTVGFDIDLQAGIMNMLMYEEEVTSDVVWTSLNSNLQIGHGDEDWRNGYFLGSINAFRKFNDFGIHTICEELMDGAFKFTLSNTPKPEMKEEINVSELEHILRTLKTAFIIKKDKVTIRDLTNFNKNINRKDIIKSIMQIDEFNLFNNSSWMLEFNNKRKEFYIKKEHMQSVENALLRNIYTKYGADFAKHIIMKEVLRWYSEDNTLTIMPFEIHEHHRDKLSEKMICKKMLEMDSANDFTDFGVFCTIDKDKDGKEIKLLRNVANI